MDYKIGDLIKIGTDAGIVKNIYTSSSGNLIELHMVKNAFGQGTHEIITQETADNLVELAEYSDILFDIEKRLTVLFGILESHIPVTKEDVEIVLTKVIRRKHNK